MGASYTTGDVAQRAVIWNGSAILDLGTLGGKSGVANAINDAGQVVGYSGTTGPNVPHATIWNGMTPTDLGTLGAESYANSINNAGHVVGYSNIAAAQHAFIWNGSAMLDLGTLGGTNSSANGINNAGQVVGDSTDVGSNYNHATIWNGGVISDLNTLLNSSGTGLTLRTAYAINRHGQIVGIGLNQAGQLRAFLLTPSDLCLARDKPVHGRVDDGHPDFMPVRCEDHDRDDGPGHDHPSGEDHER